MLIQKLQGVEDKQHGVYYEFDLHAEPLGAGGMGKVFKGEKIIIATGARIPVAIKAMYDDLPDHVIERARREASIQLHNDDLVEMFGFVETVSTTKYGEQVHHYHVISEFLNGVMLNDLLCGVITDRDGHEIPFAKELFNEYEKDRIKGSIFIIKHILSGIMALHDKGYIHRDIDPTNIMVTDKGHIKLIDFGIAKKMSSLGSQDKALTSTGTFIGKAHYAAPELVTGDVLHQNFSTDIYAIGILFYQLLTGKLPFTGPTHIILEAQLHKKPLLNNIQNRDCKKIISIATAKNQEDRYVSAAAFRVAIDSIKYKAKEKEKVSLKKKQPLNKNKTDSNKKFFSKKNIKVASIVASVVLVIAGLLMVINHWNNEREISTSYTSVNKQIIQSDAIPATSTISIDNAIAMLYSYEEKDVKNGWEIINDFADNNHSQALYELGISYSTSKKMNNITSKRCKVLNINCDNTKSHDYLKRSIKADPNNYKAIFALADDFYYNRGINAQDEDFCKAFLNRDDAKQILKKNGASSTYNNIKASFILYIEALKYAEKANDEEYVQKCKEVFKSFLKTYNLNYK